jgi:exosortase/archaeosortase family protein
MLNALWQNPTYRFLILFLGLFTFLYYLNIAVIGLVAPGGYYVPFVAKYLDYINGLRYGLMESTAFLLRQLGEQVFTKNDWMRVAGRGGFIMAYDCLGFGVMSFFTAFVIAYPKSVKSKAIFLPAGLLLIQCLNIIRFVLLGLFWKHSNLKELINHHDVFNIILYLMLMVVIYFWVNIKSETPEDTVRKQLESTTSILQN